MSVINIHSNVRDYTVFFQNETTFVNDLMVRFPERLFVIDENVWRYHKDRYLFQIPEHDRMLFTVNEECKGLESVTEIYDRLMERSAKKNLTIISVGGGILQDVTGFVASTLYRGLNWVLVPTTLLAQADSCIGSKTSLNYKRFKNLIGTFYPPSEVHIHTPFLGTLDNADFLSGLGEMVKLHLMGGAEMVADLVVNLSSVLARDVEALLPAIRNSLAVKLNFMEGDEFDTGRRNLLNFGHCFGHALETVSGYKVPHGQAVVVGIIFANLAAVQRGLLDKTIADNLAVTLLLKCLCVPLSAEYFANDSIFEAMKQDKKRINEGLVLVMMSDDYSLVKATDFTRDELNGALSRLLQLLQIR